MDISLVIPLYNEAESLPELTEWITRVMNANKFSYEILFINDGSTDNSWKVIEELSAKDEHIKGVNSVVIMENLRLYMSVLVELKEML